jgi:hypothetical protein
MQWSQALQVFVPWFLVVAAALLVGIRIATKAGFGTGMAILFGFSIPVALVFLAFSKWPIERQLLALQDLRKKDRRREAPRKVLPSVV